ncbi:hypothetical protein NP493_956g00037 [Ridgeia piscesae]|uniref:Uncharacterized protein n=1 Tax=Ridgeia piscesae TaxID=27915 RepID=A0AAD9KJS0_RIDPI|nr:hypothetical protein NP493_956g00037 [Ridgeia piscesae]
MCSCVREREVVAAGRRRTLTLTNNQCFCLLCASLGNLFSGYCTDYIFLVCFKRYFIYTVRVAHRGALRGSKEWNDTRNQWHVLSCVYGFLDVHRITGDRNVVHVIAIALLPSSAHALECTDQEKLLQIFADRFDMASVLFLYKMLTHSFISLYGSSRVCDIVRHVIVRWLRAKVSAVKF